MTALAASRKERLQTLEGEIRQGFEQFVRTGFALKEIRDDELYKEAGFATWDEYLKKRVGQQFGIEDDQARRLITCAQIRGKLPDALPSALGNGLSQNALYELRRLAPQRKDKGRSYDVGRIDRRDAARVINQVAERCAETGGEPTAAAVRKAVNEELGIDPGAKSREAKRFYKEECEKWEAYRAQLHVYLRDLHDDVRKANKDLPVVDEDAWRQFGKEYLWLLDDLNKEVATLQAKLLAARAAAGKK
jgi:hypothetical protein